MDGCRLRGDGRTAAHTRKATRAFFWDFAENLLLIRTPGEGTRRSVIKSHNAAQRLAEEDLSKAGVLSRELVAMKRHFPNNAMSGRKRASPRDRVTYPDTAARAASWGAAAQRAAIASSGVV